MSKQADDNSTNDIHGLVFALLAGVVDGGTVLSLEEQHHAESCLQCQAELIRYRKMLRALHDLRTTVIRPAPGLLADIFGSLAERGEQRAIRSILTGRKAAYAGGIAVATVAGVTGAVILMGRGRATRSKGDKKAA
jgi:hypothetical protein